MICGKEHPIEKARDMETHTKIMYSAQIYAISEEQKCPLTEAEPEPRQAYLHGMAKAAQLKLCYALYGQVGNHFNERYV